MPEIFNPVPAGRGFRLLHQKVSVDVDLANLSIAGWTELTIVPLHASLNQIILDCRQCKIHDVTIDTKRAYYTHDDMLRNSKLSPNIVSKVTAHQSEQYKRKIDGIFQSRLPGDLFIQLPKGIKIIPNDNSSSESGGVVHDMFQPLTVRVEFSVARPVDGINFVGGTDSNIKKQFWHAYTTHSPIGRSTSGWLPCVDGLWDLSSWEIEISVPRTIRDIIKLSNEEYDEVPDGPEDLALDQEICVVCSNLSPKEIAHPFNSSKKVVSFNFLSPISAQHVGFAVGPFIQVPIVDLRENDDEVQTEDDGTSAPISAYCLSDRVTDTSNTCVFLYRAMEFYTKEFGSYPFHSYSMCFVANSPCEFASAVGLTMCSDELLFPPEAIDPLFTNTEKLSSALAAQWIGVNILPASWNDIWATIGIGRYMALQFVKRLIGSNEYRYRMKKRANEVCRQDLNKPPLAYPEFRFPLMDKDLDFIRLKAPAILFILDRRMTKTDRSFGLLRVISKLFLQSMSQDLNSTLSTAHLIKLCERVSHHQLEQFFDQWVYGPGYPVFRVTQRFNKKRMFIEMGIRQVQSSEVNNPVLAEETFVDDAARYLSDREVSQVTQPTFTGSMTIRIHEADGTPYEHVVELKDSFTKLDIQYNTKYKRLKRNQRRGGGAGTSSLMVPSNGPNGTTTNADDPVEHHASGSVDPDGEDLADSQVLLHCLGDVLQTDAEVAEWKLSDWGNEEEERMVNEAFEWMRVDADFEWICLLYINQPDYMFASQLQQDRDVVAQYDAVEYFGNQKPSALYSSMLLRTLVDKRYYYGIREEAAMALARNSVDDNGHIGKFHLMKAFQLMFCFEGSLIPQPNDFSDFPTYFVEKAIILALSTIRDSMGNCPMDIKQLLLDLLRYNENDDNPYSDSYYICDLIRAIVNSLRVDEASGGSSTVVGDTKLREMLHKAVAEIDRCQRMDQWMPSIQNMVAILVIRQKELLARGGYITPSFEACLKLSRPGNDDLVRLAAFQSIADLGGLKSRELMHYLFYTASTDSSLRIRTGLVEVLTRAVGVLALFGDRASISQKKNVNGRSMVIENGTINANGQSSIDARREALARSTVGGAIGMARRDASRPEFHAFEQELWRFLTVNNENIGIGARKILLDICQVLYEPRQKYVVTLRSPRTWKLAAKNLGSGKVVIKREPKKMPSTGKSKKHVVQRSGTTLKIRTLKRPEPDLSISNHNSVRVEKGTPSKSLMIVIPKAGKGYGEDKIRAEGLDRGEEEQVEEEKENQSKQDDNENRDKDNETKDVEGEKMEIDEDIGVNKGDDKVAEVTGDVTGDVAEAADVAEGKEDQSTDGGIMRSRENDLPEDTELATTAISNELDVQADETNLKLSTEDNVLTELENNETSLMNNDQSSTEKEKEIEQKQLPKLKILPTLKLKVSKGMLRKEEEEEEEEEEEGKMETQTSQGTEAADKPDIDVNAEADDIEMNDFNEDEHENEENAVDKENLVDNQSNDVNVNESESEKTNVQASSPSPSPAPKPKPLKIKLKF